MRIPHDSMVLVADGAKFLFLRNHGDADAIDLRVEDAAQQEDAADQDLKTDAAGRKPGGHTIGEADYHAQAEERFAADAAALINRAAQSNDYERLVIVAPPKTLGALRARIEGEAAERIVAEIPKDLVGHPTDRIAAALQAYEAA